MVHTTFLLSPGKIDGAESGGSPSSEIDSTISGSPLEHTDLSKVERRRATESVVLVLDDSADILDATRYQLESYGFAQVLTAISEAEALAIAQKLKIDLLISDVDLGANGDSNRAVTLIRATQPNMLTFRVSGVAQNLKGLDADLCMVKSEFAMQASQILRTFFEF